MRVGGERHLHAVLGSDGLCGHAHITDHQFLACGHVDGKMTIKVGFRALLCALHHDSGSNARLTGVLQDRTGDFVLSEGYS